MTCDHIDHIDNKGTTINDLGAEENGGPSPGKKNLEGIPPGKKFLEGPSPG